MKIQQLLAAFTALVKEPASSQARQDFLSALDEYRTDADDRAAAQIAFRVDSLAGELRRDGMTPRERLADRVRNMHRANHDQYNEHEDALSGLNPREKFLRQTADMHDPERRNLVRGGDR